MEMKNKMKNQIYLINLDHVNNSFKRDSEKEIDGVVGADNTNK